MPFVAPPPCLRRPHLKNALCTVHLSGCCTAPLPAAPPAATAAVGCSQRMHSCPRQPRCHAARALLQHLPGCCCQLAARLLRAPQPRRRPPARRPAAGERAGTAAVPALQLCACHGGSCILQAVQAAKVLTCLHPLPRHACHLHSLRLPRIAACALRALHATRAALGLHWPPAPTPACHHPARCEPAPTPMHSCTAACYAHRRPAAAAPPRPAIAPACPEGAASMLGRPLGAPRARGPAGRRWDARTACRRAQCRSQPAAGPRCSSGICMHHCASSFTHSRPACPLPPAGAAASRLASARPLTTSSGRRARC